MTTGADGFPAGAGSSDSLDTRLGRLEGLLHGLQTTLLSSQTTVTNFLTKISELEKRQVELERQMVTSEELRDLSSKTSDDMRELTKTVEALVASENRLQGKSTQTQFTLPLVIQLGTLIIAALALFNSLSNRQVIDRSQSPEIQQQK